ncbi:MAG: hypothetical protein AB7I19_00035 [Planctomycetota bacterium]
MKPHLGTIDFAWFLLSVFAVGELGAQPPRRSDAPRLAPGPETLARLDFRPGSAFALGELGDSSAIDGLLARPLTWLETPHFRIGTDLATLSPHELSKPRWHEIEAEAKSMGGAALLAQWRRWGLDGRWRQLLLALHLERQWNELECLLPPIDESSPPTGPAVDLEGRGRGCGPMLGRDAKFVVLVFAQSIDLRRFCVDFLGDDSRGSRRADLGGNDALLYCTAEEIASGGDRDRDLLAHVTFGVIANLVDGYRGAHQPAPAWLRFGLAQSFALAIDPTASNAETNGDANGDANERSRRSMNWWELLRRTRSDAAFGPGARFEADIARRDLSGASREDLVRVWSYVEFLRRRDGEALGRFLFEQKDRIPSDFSKSTAEILVERQRKNLSRILGFADPAAFETAWESWRVRRKP